MFFSVDRYWVLTLKINRHVTYKILTQILPVNEHVTKQSTRNWIFSSFLKGKKKGKVCIRANVAHQAGAYPGFCSTKRLRVFLLPPGWDASPSQGYPPALSLPVPIYTPGWREAPWELSVLPKNTTQCPRPGLEPRPLAPESSALTMRPPRLPIFKSKLYKLLEICHLIKLQIKVKVINCMS